MIETCVGLFSDRHLPASMIAESCKALEASPAVDGVLIPDQLASFLPIQLWNKENTPLAEIMSDVDSQCDAFVIGAYAAAHAPSLKLHLTTDSVRRPPAELTQALWTLAQITDGKFNIQIGGGEIKQTGPFGHPTNQGMSRLKDFFEIYKRFSEGDGPFDYEGKRWNFQNAWLGNARNWKPEIWGLGAGPMLLDYTTTYADGLAIAVPMAVATPEGTAELISALRKQVEEKGRDPEKFRIGLWATVMVHEDEAELDKFMDNPIIKFTSGTLGRVETHHWKDEGLELPFPDGWTYYKNLLPYGMDDTFVEDMVDAVTREHVEKAWFTGKPEDVAKKIAPYLEAGVDWIMPIDYLPVVGSLEDAGKAAARGVALCEELKKL